MKDVAADTVMVVPDSVPVPESVSAIEEETEKPAATIRLEKSIRWRSVDALGELSGSFTMIWSGLLIYGNDR